MPNYILYFFAAVGMVITFIYFLVIVCEVILNVIHKVKLRRVLIRSLGDRFNVWKDPGEPESEYLDRIARRLADYIKE